jgi:PHD/YefM family antitoxin component YafN of YafNO toxin-antitoxin module
MISVNIEKASQSLAQLIYDTIKNCEETLIVSDTGSVVLIDQAEWENIQETLKLLHDEKSLKALIEGHKARDQDVRPDSVSIEDAFYDL